MNPMCTPDPDFGSLVATVGISTFFYFVVKVLRERSNSDEEIAPPKYSHYLFGGVGVLIVGVVLSYMGCAFFS